MRLAVAAVLLVQSILLLGCSPSLSSRPRPSGWSTGFWFWHGSALDAERFPGPVDVLYVHAGYIRGGEDSRFIRPTSRERSWTAFGALPEELPAAREYWLVWRFERQGVPDLPAAPPVAREFARLAETARGLRLNVAGVQLDIDSPTAALPEYARFIQALRKELPQGTEISITALLDWFRAGTAVGRVIREADEFVPQFYDVQGRDDYGGGAAIAAPVDAARWGPAFRGFGKRFRVGISTFGRARMAEAAEGAAGRRPGAALFRDLALMDVAANSAFEMQSTRNQAGELVLSYRASRSARIGYRGFHPGDTVQFILAAPESVRAAVESVRQMGGPVAGVVFFRWPAFNESLTMQPGEALAAAGTPAAFAETRARVHAVDGRCAAVECVDLYLQGAAPLAPKAVRYVIRASTALEYFVPEPNMPVRMTGPNRLELRVPPFGGRARFYLGRAVSVRRSEFTAEEAP